ncbi:MAG: leucine-rich repeat domain-containing protein [Bacteroidota bacterium]
MQSEFDFTESDVLGYYTTFEALFPDFSHLRSDKEKKEPIEVNFRFTDEDTPPSAAQLATNDFLVQHAQQLLINLLNYLKQDEEYFMEFYGVYREISQEVNLPNGRSYTSVNKLGFPAVQTVEEYLRYFGISSINISDLEKDGATYLGFSGGCPWDSEHGFGAAFLKDELLHVSNWDLGYNPSWGGDEHKKAERLTNNFIQFHQLESLVERKKRLRAASTALEVADPEPYNNLFDWLAEQQMIYGYRNTPVDLTTTEKVIVIKELTTLSFYGNPINTVPATFPLLEQLSSLSFSFNEFTDFPNPVLKLPKLEKLTLINNSLRSIPKEIGHLKQLSTLQFNRNQLQALPETLGDLIQLKYVDFSFNQLHDLPKSISNWSEIEHLWINNNSFSRIPEGIIQLENLNRFELRNNQLTAVPDAIAELPRLEWLDLKHNQLKTIPDALVHQGSKLKTLSVRGNLFTANTLERLLGFIRKDLQSDLELELSLAKDRVIQELKAENQQLKEEKKQPNQEASSEEKKDNKAPTSSEEKEKPTPPNQGPKDPPEDDKKWWQFWKK